MTFNRTTLALATLLAFISTPIVAKAADISPLYELFTVPIDQTEILNRRLGKSYDNTDFVGESMNNENLTIRKGLLFVNLPEALKAQNVGSIQINYIFTKDMPGMNIIVRARPNYEFSEDDISAVMHLFDSDGNNWQSDPTSGINDKRGLYVQVPNSKGMVIWGGELGKSMLERTR